MPKFSVSQRKIVTFQGHIEIELPEGVDPVRHINEETNAGRDPFAGAWQDVAASMLSIDIAPIEEPVVEI